MSKIRRLRLILYPFLFILLVVTFILYDRSRVVSDFANTKIALMEARAASIMDRKQRVAKFTAKTLELYESGKLLRTEKIKTLHAINYNTTLGDSMIVFDAHGTNRFNKKVHGGDITFKSWLGFTKSLWVNCTGYVVEGLMPTNHEDRN